MPRWLADRAAKDLGVPVDALYYHGVPLDMAKPLKAQGVFRDPVLLGVEVGPSYVAPS